MTKMNFDFRLVVFGIEFCNDRSKRIRNANQHHENENIECTGKTDCCLSYSLIHELSDEKIISKVHSDMTHVAQANG